MTSKCLGVIHDLSWQAAAWVFTNKTIHVRWKHWTPEFGVTTYHHPLIKTEKIVGGCISFWRNETTIFWTENSHTVESNFSLEDPSRGPTWENPRPTSDSAPYTRRAWIHPVFRFPDLSEVGISQYESDDFAWTSVLSSERKIRAFSIQHGEIISQTFGGKRVLRRRFTVGPGAYIVDVHPTRGDLILLRLASAKKDLTRFRVLRMTPRNWEWLTPPIEHRPFWTRLGFRLPLTGYSIWDPPQIINHPFEFWEGTRWALVEGEPKIII